MPIHASPSTAASASAGESSTTTKPAGCGTGTGTGAGGGDPVTVTVCNHVPTAAAAAAAPNLFHFLSRFRVEKGCEHTHTSFARPSGAFYVPASQHPRLFELYRGALARGEEAHLTERHRHIGPVVVDLDFRFEASAEELAAGAPPPARRHGAALPGIVEVYARAIASLVEAPPQFDLFVMEKPSASLAKGVVKDGVHIIVPAIVTRTAVQLMLRTAVLPQVAAALEPLRPLNRAEDIVDEAVIERNNWLMYGSRKPGGDVYRVAAVYRFTCADGGAMERLGKAADYEPEAGEAGYVELFSLRNKYDESPIREDRLQAVADFVQQTEERHRRREAINLVVAAEANARPNTCDNMDEVSLLVDMLDAGRAESYSEWVRVGWCLRNIDHRLLEKWIEFSKRSPKYIDGECPRLWNHMRQGGLGIGTLHMWARNDAPDRYRDMVRDSLRALLLNSCSGAEHDSALVVQRMYRYDYVCASLRNRIWYEFRDHRWRECDSACSLRKRVSTEVFREYTNLSTELNGRASTASDQDSRNLLETVKRLNSVALGLKKTKTKDNVIKECAELFYHQGFDELLDANVNLIGFENGVYDLERAEFRDGRPDDYISNTTGNNYIHYQPDHPKVLEIKRYWEQVHVDPDIRAYVLKTLASCLSGQVKQERFNIWTGSGSNSKSKSVDLFEKAFGGYCVKFPVTLLTQKRAASNAATSEVARAKGKRFGVLQEPSEDERLNIGLMKEMTGGDKIMARPLYREPFEFLPQFKMFLLCNQLPNVPSDDGGTWRRIRVVEWASKFCEKPNPDKPNEFPIDLELTRKLDGWKEHFMAMLIDQYHKSASGHIEEPDAVMVSTREYQRINDFLADFLDSCIERVADATAFLTLDAALLQAREWMKTDNPGSKGPKRRELQAYIDKNLARSSSVQGHVGWKGYRLRDRLPLDVIDGGDPLDAPSAGGWA